MSTTLSRQAYYDGRYKFQSTENGTQNPINNAGSLSLWGTDTVTKDGPVPQWERLIALGANATSNLSGTRHRVEGNDADITFGVESISPYFTSKQKYVMHLWGRYPNVPAPVIPGGMTASLIRADNLARTRFYSNLAEVETAFKGLTFAGELKESLQMIRNPIRSIRQGVRDYLDHVKKHGRRLPSYRRPGFVRDSWLEYSFGWKPLISDADNAMTAFFSSRHIKPMFSLVRGNANDIESEVVTPRSQTAGFSHTYSWDQVTRRECKVKYYGIYHSIGKGRNNLHHYGFAPWEFVPTLWELIPYSFLVDYFTNVGDIVSSWSYRFLSLEWSSKGQKRDSYIFNRNAKVKLNPGSIHDNADWIDFQTGSLSESNRSLSIVDRFRQHEVAVPSLELQIPGLSSTKWVNIAALTKQFSDTRRVLRT